MGKVMGILFLIMIDTLYVYHRPVFSPKMTLNAVYNSSIFAPCFASLCVNVCVFSVFFPLQNERFLMMAYPLLITMDNVWNGDCVRTPFCYRVRRHSVSPSQCHSASKPLFTQKLQNGFLRHFFLFFCVAHFGRLQKLETTNVATSMFSP